MTGTTKPAKKGKDVAPKRTAPRLATLKPDAYADLSPTEKQRYDCLRDLEAIFDAIPRATLDRDSVGFAASFRPRIGSRSTDEGALNMVEAASEFGDPAGDWLAEVTECRAMVTNVGNRARKYWPAALASGTVMSQDGQQITVGGRTNTVTLCTWCGEPAPSGRNETTGATLVKHAMHNPTCYQAAYRAAGKSAKMTIDEAVTAHALERKKAS